MNYQTLLADTMNLVFSDIERALWVATGSVIVCAIIGVRNSMKKCTYTGHVGRRIL